MKITDAVFIAKSSATGEILISHFDGNRDYRPDPLSTDPMRECMLRFIMEKKPRWMHDAFYRIDEKTRTLFVHESAARQL